MQWCCDLTHTSGCCVSGHSSLGRILIVSQPERIMLSVDV